MTTTAPFQLVVYHEKDWIDDLLEGLGYLGPVGALLAGGGMALRRMPVLVDAPVALINWVRTGQLPESMPRLDEVFPTARPHIAKLEAIRDAELKAENERKEEREFYTSMRRTQQKAVKEVAKDNMIKKLAQLFLDKKTPDNSHIQFVGLTGSGKGATVGAFLDACLEIDPTIKFLHINPKYKKKEFEESYEPHFKGIEQAAIGISEAVLLMERRLADPEFDSNDSDLIIVVINELKYVYDMFPETAKNITTLTNVMRGANMRLLIDTQSYNASEHGLSDPCFSSFIKVILGGLQPKFLATKTGHINKQIVRTLEMQVTSYTQQQRRAALIVPAKGAPHVELIPHLEHAFERMECQHPPMPIEGINEAVIEVERLVIPALHGQKIDEPIRDGRIKVEGNKAIISEVVFTNPPKWGTKEADDLMLKNKAHFDPVGIGKMAKAFGVGVQTYYKRLAELENDQNENEGE